VESGHPAIRQAGEEGIPTLTRSAYLEDLFNRSRGLAVAGTSGKTTVTGMLAWMLKQCGQKPTVFCGDEILNYAKPETLGNYLPGRDDPLVLELDESEGRNLEIFRAQSACITSITKDHFDLATLLGLFERFASAAKRLVVSLDCPETRSLGRRFPGKTRSVSLADPEADFFASDIRPDGEGIAFRMNGISVRLGIPGRFNVRNALFAAALAEGEGIPPERALREIRGFLGIRNRFECLRASTRRYVLDFAHNPEKIRASFSAAREFGTPVHYVFQPHGYGPLRFMMDDLVSLFHDLLRPCDRLYLLPVYDAGGTADRSVKSADLAVRIARSNARNVANRQSVIDAAGRWGDRPATWVVSGARDPTLRDFFLDLTRTDPATIPPGPGGARPDASVGNT
jgi:UDP-N-acetylmuramate--alanine ligase